MTRALPKPDLIFVHLIHRSLRVDAARLATTLAALGPGERTSRLPGIQAFFVEYRGQLLTHHTHEDELFFPALEARVGAERMHLSELDDQHEALDAAIHAVDDALHALADPAGDFATDLVRATDAVSSMAELLAAHLTLEEQTALPLFESDLPLADYKKLETKVRKATPGARRSS
jgi:hemerythrin-like domain-containing protein